jgi:hypothetical protein
MVSNMEMETIPAILMIVGNTVGFLIGMWIIINSK